MEFIVIYGAEHVVTIDNPDEGVEVLVTAADCPCGDTSWAIERSGYCNENAAAVCESCGKEYPIEYRRDGEDALTEARRIAIAASSYQNAIKLSKKWGMEMPKEN